MVLVLHRDRLAIVRTLDLGDPFGPGLSASNLRCAPISTAIPIASVRCAHCALRLPSRLTGCAEVPAHRARHPPSGSPRSRSRFAQRSQRRVPLPRRPVAGFARHRAAHRAVYRCPHQCGHLRPRLRQRASRDCLRRWPQCPPLKRRGGSPPPASPASIPPSLIPLDLPFLTARGGLFVHTRRIVDAVRAVAGHVRLLLRYPMTMRSPAQPCRAGNSCHRSVAPSTDRNRRKHHGFSIGYRHLRRAPDSCCPSPAMLFPACHRSVARHWATNDDTALSRTLRVSHDPVRDRASSRVERRRFRA